MQVIARVTFWPGPVAPGQLADVSEAEATSLVQRGLATWPVEPAAAKPEGKKRGRPPLPHATPPAQPQPDAAADILNPLGE